MLCTYRLVHIFFNVKNKTRKIETEQNSLVHTKESLLSEKGKGKKGEKMKKNE